MTGVLFFLRLGLYPILIILQAIDFLFDTDVPSLDNFDATVTGCGRFGSVSQVYHPSPYLRNIFEYHCGQCGIEFVSSILQTAPYSNTVLLQAQYQEGCHDCDWIEDNGANLTPIQLLDLLKDVFNADYRIKNGKLYFEWKEFFKDNQLLLENADTVYANGQAEEPPCYEYVEQRGHAYGRFEYANDSIDEAGNASAGLYNDIVEWNNPPRDIQRGEYSVRLEFSPARFMRDKEQKRIVFHDIDNFRAGRYTDGLMIMKSGKASNFKLLSD
jgi:thiol-disulfide isomerase/thioredoxin